MLKVKRENGANIKMFNSVTIPVTVSEKLDQYTTGKPGRMILALDSQVRRPAIKSPIWWSG